MDLAELELDSGRATLYKWGAAPSWLVTGAAPERLGVTGPPPGMSVTEQRELVVKLSLRRKEVLLLVSDGVPEDSLVRWKVPEDATPGQMAAALLENDTREGQDDATVVTVRLRELAV